MKRYVSVFYVVFFFSIFFLSSFCGFAFASEGVNSWRPIYDTVMLWLNFFILVFVIVKFGKKPLMSFLSVTKESIEKDVLSLEKKRDKMLDDNKIVKKQIKESSHRFSQLKAKILHQAEQEKEELINSAKIEGQYVMEAAKRRVENQIEQAKNRFKCELIDASMKTVGEIIPGKITDDKNQLFIDNYLKSL
jgi:F-type H+-transporting ATPase subunit b